MTNSFIFPNIFQPQITFPEPLQRPPKEEVSIYKGMKKALRRVARQLSSTPLLKWSKNISP
jgi:hypothetical protein